MRAKARSFQDLIVWQKSHHLTLHVYEATERFPRHELYGLTSQIRRAAASVPSNIAEGFARNSPGDALRFYKIADASLAELKYQIILGLDLGYMTQETYALLEQRAEEVGRLMHGWISSQA